LRARVDETQALTYLNAAGWRHKTKDGTILDVEISSHALTFGGRRARLVLASDVSRRLQAEAAVIAAKESAEAANRAKDRFLAVLSHELRTPLTPILLSVSAMLDKGTATEEMRPTLEMIRRNIELESRLVDDLLDVARIARGGIRNSPEVLDIHQAIRESIEICRPAIQAAQIEIKLDLRAEQPNAMADPARIKQVFWNLIRNAAKFTPAGGSLTIRTENRAIERDGESQNRLVVEFADTGIGIDPAFLPRVFEPFEQGDSSHGHRHGGLGLGLAISRAIVQSHGGELTGRSEGRNRGTTFRLELASIPAPTATAAKPPCEKPASPGPGSSILLVEDNRDTLRFLTLVLGQKQFDVHPAENLESARAAAADGKHFDLLISDIELPDGTGLELMRELGHDRVSSGIAMSGFGSEDDVRMSMEAGFSEHLTKPIDIARLETAIDRALTIARAREPVA
jgi:signal transduction histidine kinase/ActR/RegA family two-component response regulator